VANSSFQDLGTCPNRLVEEKALQSLVQNGFQLGGRQEKPRHILERVIYGQARPGDECRNVGASRHGEPTLPVRAKLPSLVLTPKLPAPLRWLRRCVIRRCACPVRSH